MGTQQRSAPRSIEVLRRCARTHRQALPGPRLVREHEKGPLGAQARAVPGKPRLRLVAGPPKTTALLVSGETPSHLSEVIATARRTSRGCQVVHAQRQRHTSISCVRVVADSPVAPARNQCRSCSGSRCRGRCAAPTLPQVVRVEGFRDPAPALPRPMVPLVFAFYPGAGLNRLADESPATACRTSMRTRNGRALLRCPSVRLGHCGLPARIRDQPAQPSRASVATRLLEA